MPFSKNKILDVMRSKTYRPLLIKELMYEAGVSRDDREEFKNALRALIVEGEVVKIRGDRYGLPDKMNLVVGKLSAHPDGYAFVMPEKEGEPDVYVGRRDQLGAMHGDKVVARVEREEGGNRLSGRIIRILDRAMTRVVGRYEAGRGFGVVVSTNMRVTNEFYVPPKNSGGATNGDLVTAEIVSYPEPHRSAVVNVTKVMGRAGEPGLDTDLIIEEHNLKTVFSDAALKEAKATPRGVTAEMLAGRRDLRNIRTVTIDGERARDFDDAVAVERLAGGKIRLYVSIADVSHYVRPGAPLDVDARERATSVYFPDRVLPMLPEELSNGICSLNPDVDRLTLTAEMVFDEAGNRVSSDFYESVIKSWARMTYTDVAAIIEKDDPETKEKYADFVPDFALMHELMGRLNRMRRGRGSIDFDLPEPEVVVNLQGVTTDILKSERNEAHRLIEEFMLAANEAVAGHLEAHGVPFLYRIHEEPDEEKMAELGTLVKGYGLPWPGEGAIRPKTLANLIEKLKGMPEERYLNTIVLRSMKLARYGPENLGHFGLASSCYCHFTSPIRRYPDLLVHRALKEQIRSGELPAERKSAVAASLPYLGQHCSFMEREAEDAERQVVELKKLQFMMDKVGAEFPGFVSGVTAFGFFVELEEFFVEGLVRLTSLHDDYYTYEGARHELVGSHTGRTFRLGDKVTIVLDRVDMERRRMEFSVVGLEQPPSPRAGVPARPPVRAAASPGRPGKSKPGGPAVKPAEASRKTGKQSGNPHGKPAGKPAGKTGGKFVKGKPKKRR